jgi:hypothetical protein
MTVKCKTLALEVISTIFAGRSSGPTGRDTRVTPQHLNMATTNSNASKSRSPSPSPNEHLSFPVIPAESDQQPSVLPQHPRQVLKDRLYIGNLHPSVDEYVTYSVRTF